ncbi:MAG: FixH family protein, partial [Phycisphaerales bacterium]|nr:FixH family protein [Phycisphaerales bacterium]
MIHLRKATCLVVVTLVIAAGCESTRPARSTDTPSASSKKPPSAARGLKGNIHSAKSDDGRYELSYSTSPDPLPLNEMFSIEVALLDTSTGAPPAAPDLALTVDARMPEHQHGMNVTPKVENLGDGRFKVSRMLFHMPGYWELYFDIVVAGVAAR